MWHELRWLILVTAYGGCVGSFLNVVIYRLPAGKSLWHPGSACPKCGHALAWYDNVPVLGWLWLRGRCRYCRETISTQYPIVEALTAALFAGLFIVYYHPQLRLLRGPDWPPFVDLPVSYDGTWPAFIVHVALLAGLLAATVVDLRQYIIPLGIPWTVALFAAIILPVAALLTGGGDVEKVSPQIEAGSVNLVAGATAGWVLACVLLWLRVLPLSFAEPPPPDPNPDAPLASDSSSPSGLAPAPTPDSRPELSAPAPSLPDSRPELPPAVPSLAEVPPAAVDGPIVGTSQAVPTVVPTVPIPPTVVIPQPGSPMAETPTTPAAQPEAPVPDVAPQSPPLSPRWRAVLLLAPFVIAPCLWLILGPWGLGIGILLLWLDVLLVGIQSEERMSVEEATEFLIHPQPQVEVLKECLFLVWPILGAVLGARYLPNWVGTLTRPQQVSVCILGGVAAGFLVGGMLIWATRIGGTLAFGKEAMGLGDVHLLAGIGAVLGWPAAVVVFLLAPFMGLLAAVLSYGVARLARGQVRVIPYGPYLATAAIVVMIFHQPLRLAVAHWFGLQGIP
jgi:prepilin signal peptidase PulO-like enzyme (type II secretory pathway)